MCRSTDIHGFHFNVDRNRLKINGLCVRVSLLRSCKPLPESLTLVYLPRINASPLDVNGSKIRPDSPAFVTLHRVVLGEKQGRAGRNGGVVYASRERVRASEGVRFEVFWGEEKVVKGIFRKDEGEKWKMECKCALENKMLGIEVTEAEVCVAVEGDGEGHVAMSEKLEMVVKRKKKMKCFLEEIPEEREVEDDETDGCDCGGCCFGGERDQTGLDGGDCEMKDGDEGDEEVEMEGVRWAVDVGILVMSLGLGFLVSKASSKSLRLGRIL